MAQSQQTYPPRAFSPLQSGASPHSSFLGPNKRQRLSPNAQSPYNSPSMSNIALPLPNQLFSSPYYGAQPNVTMPNNSYNTMNSSSHAGTMGPPSRPVDKPTDMNELTDVLLGSGVDLKEEEAALLGRSNHNNQYQADTSFSSGLLTPFNSFGSNASSAGTATANKSSIALSQNVPGDKSSFYGAGTFNQAATPYQSIEERAEMERKKAIRRKAERRQYHLNDPFLLTGWVQQRINKITNSMQVENPNTGLLNPTNHAGQVTEMAVTGPDNHEVLTTLKGQALLYQDSPLVEILTLISLAAGERVRMLVEDAAALAKGRRVGSHGIVPADLADLAVEARHVESGMSLPTPGNSAVSPKTNPLKRSHAAIDEPATPGNSAVSPKPNPLKRSHAATEKLLIPGKGDVSPETNPSKRSRATTDELSIPSNSAVSPKTNTLKRSYAEMNKLPTPVSDGNRSPSTTVTFPNILVDALRQRSQAERALEEERVSKRARRTAAASQAGDSSRAGSIPPGTSGSSTPGLLGERAPDVETKRGSKKDQKRQAEAKATEAQQAAATNKTTSMALGLGGSLGKTLSWMQKDSGSGSGSSHSLSRVNTNTQGLSRSATTNGLGSSVKLPVGRKHGQFREDRETGAGIQIRDLVLVLEADRRQKRALAKVYSKLR